MKSKWLTEWVFGQSRVQMVSDQEMFRFLSWPTENNGIQTEAGKDARTEDKPTKASRR